MCMVRVLRFEGDCLCCEGEVDEMGTESHILGLGLR